MKKLLALLFFLLLVLTSCSNGEKEVSTKVSGEEVEKLSPLEEVSKTCLESSASNCRDIFNQLGDQIDDEFSKEVLDNYSALNETMYSERNVTDKMTVIDMKMDYLSSKAYEIVLKNNRELGNKHYVKLIEEKVYPLSELYNSKKIKVGMSEIEVIISLGFPNKINTTTTANTVSQQWVYDNYNAYVYIDDGEVTSYQN